MSKLRVLEEGVDIPGLSLRLVVPAWISTLRFFEPSGAFVSGLAGLVGGPMPGPQQAVCYPGATPGSELVLASRGPTDILLMCTQPPPALREAIDEFARDRRDGCVVHQSGGYRVWSASGARAGDLLARLGSTPLPARGEARAGRLAELSVLSLCIHAGEVVLLVDRLYSQHLEHWISATLDDF